MNVDIIGSDADAVIQHRDVWLKLFTPRVANEMLMIATDGRISAGMQNHVAGYYLRAFVRSDELQQEVK